MGMSVWWTYMDIWQLDTWHVYDKMWELVESFANTNYFAHPPIIPRNKKRDNDNIVMMSSTVPNLPIFIPPPIAKTQDSASSNSSQPRMTVKVELPTPQQSDDL